jgi:hypothetical protein
MCKRASYLCQGVWHWVASVGHNPAVYKLVVSYHTPIPSSSPNTYLKYTADQQLPMSQVNPLQWPQEPGRRQYFPWIYLEGVPGELAFDLVEFEHPEELADGHR